MYFNTGFTLQSIPGVHGCQTVISMDQQHSAIQPNYNHFSLSEMMEKHFCYWYLFVVQTINDKSNCDYVHIYI